MWGVVVTRQEEQQPREVRERRVGCENQDARGGRRHNVRPEASATKGSAGKLHDDRRLRVGKRVQPNDVRSHRDPNEHGHTDRAHDHQRDAGVAPFRRLERGNPVADRLHTGERGAA